jgi:hypothetical protein
MGEMRTKGPRKAPKWGETVVKQRKTAPNSLKSGLQ